MTKENLGLIRPGMSQQNPPPPPSPSSAEPHIQFTTLLLSARGCPTCPLRSLACWTAHHRTRIAHKPMSRQTPDKGRQQSPGAAHSAGTSHVALAVFCALSS